MALLATKADKFWSQPMSTGSVTLEDRLVVVRSGMQFSWERSCSRRPSLLCFIFCIQRQFLALSSLGCAEISGGRGCACGLFASGGGLVSLCK